jgi:hypothetical protein
MCIFFSRYSNKKNVKTLGFVLLINIYIKSQDPDTGSGSGVENPDHISES